MRPSARTKEVAGNEHSATRTFARAQPSAAALSDRTRAYRAPGTSGEKGGFLRRLPRRSADARGRRKNPETSPDAYRDGTVPVPKNHRELRLQIPALARPQADPRASHRPLYAKRRQ